MRSLRKWVCWLALGLIVSFFGRSPALADELISAPTRAKIPPKEAPERLDRGPVEVSLGNPPPP
jgi:hypothetical protein